MASRYAERTEPALDSRRDSGYSFSPGSKSQNTPATPTSTQSTTPQSRTPLTVVVIVMGMLAFAIAAALEYGGLRSPDIADAGPVPFVLVVVAGALAGWVASFAGGILAGLTTGFTYALGGGLVQMLARGAAMPLRSVAAALLLMTLLGAVLGAIGAAPFSFARWRRDQLRARKF